jgi:peroxiredoxin
VLFFHDLGNNRHAAFFSRLDCALYGTLQWPDNAARAPVFHTHNQDPGQASSRSLTMVLTKMHFFTSPRMFDFLPISVKMDGRTVAQDSHGGIMPIAVGQTAPDFTLKDQNQQEVKLSDFAGKKNVVLAFYPLDWSPVCSNEMACFANDLKQFETLDAAVLGLSVDSVWSHKAFAEKIGVQFSLLADFHPKGAVAEKFGMYLADKGITGRAVAIIDRAGKVAWFKQYDIPQLPDLKEVADALSKLK